MASNIPLPSGEGSPDYYQRMFGDRVRSVRKGGGGSGGGSGGGGSRWNGGAAAGVCVAILLGILRVASSSRPTPPPPPHFTPPAFNPGALDDLDRIQKQLQDLQFQPQPVPFPGVPPVAPDVQPDDPNALSAEDVPLWAGLCYRIDQESKQPQPTLGRQICSLLDEEPLKLLRRAAAGADLNADDREELLDGLNEVLDNPKLHDANDLRGVQLPAADQAVLEAVFNRDEKAVRKANRALLEAAYPRQIIPVRLKDKLDDGARRAWQDGARKDLAAAKRQYGSRK